MLVIISESPVKSNRIMIIFFIRDSLIFLDKRIPINNPISIKGISSIACFAIVKVSKPVDM